LEDLLSLEKVSKYLEELEKTLCELLGIEFRDTMAKDTECEVSDDFRSKEQELRSMLTNSALKELLVSIGSAIPGLISDTKKCVENIITKSNTFPGIYLNKYVIKQSTDQPELCLDDIIKRIDEMEQRLNSARETGSDTEQLDGLSLQLYNLEEFVCSYRSQSTDWVSLPLKDYIDQCKYECDGNDHFDNCGSSGKRLKWEETSLQKWFPIELGERECYDIRKIVKTTEESPHHFKEDDFRMLDDFAKQMDANYKQLSMKHGKKDTVERLKLLKIKKEVCESKTLQRYIENYYYKHGWNMNLKTPQSGSYDSKFDGSSLEQWFPQP